MFTKQPSHNTNSKSNNLSPFQKRNDGTAFIQPKLNIGKPGDSYEVEADRTADAIVSMKDDRQTAFFSPSPIIQQQAKAEEEEGIQAKAEAEEEEVNVQAKAEVEAEEEEVQTKSETDVETQNKEFAESQVQQKPEISAINPVVQQKVEEEIQEKEEEEEEPVQTKLLLQKSDEPDTVAEEGPLPVQAKSDGTEVGTTSIESQLNSSKGGGSPLNGNVQTQMESGFGTDFSNVRVHTDSTAVQMNKNLGAQAFTHGRDIYFNEGKYNPESDSGKHLLAHELTHTVQQGAAVQEKMVQKVDGEEVEAPPGVNPLNETNGEFSFSEDGGVTVFNQATNEIILPSINLPSFKVRNEIRIANLRIRSLRAGGQQIPDSQAAETERQREIWNHFIQDTAQRLVTDKMAEARRNGGYSRTQDIAERIYFFKGIRNDSMVIFGREEQLLEIAKIPIWDSEENPTNFQVDHIFETQLGGQNRVSNYELLEASANSSSGAKIMWDLNRKAKRVYDVLNHPYYQNKPEADRPHLPPRPATLQQYMNGFLRDFDFGFANLEFNLPPGSGQPERFWSFNNISQGQHLNKIEALTGDEMRELGTEDDPALFVSPSGGKRLEIPEGDDYPKLEWLDRVDLLSRPDFENLTLRVDAYKAKDDSSNSVDASYSQMEWHLSRIPETYIFYINKDLTIQNALSGSTGVFQSLRLPGMSPIQITSLDITENGFVGIGKVLPTVPLIGDADIDIVIDGDGIRLRKLFSSEEFDFPSPFEINEATLEVSFGTEGLGIEGQVNFGINNVGEGHIGAAASTGGGFELEGAFNFDSELFDPAEINVEYKENIWTIGGEIGIPEGKVRGVKNATITASYSENNFTATGNAELDIPGIERGTMTVNYGDEGFSIGGNFDLSSDIPGIQGGNVEARVSKEEGAENYDVFVSGTAQPDIPGIDTSLSVTYDNGALTIEGRAAYSRGMLSGNINIGATNRAIGEDGQPSGEPDATMRVYGGGDLTLQLTPWLQATAGVQFLPNGEIEITGRIALPSTVDVFDRREFRRNLFTVPTIEIPLFAIPLGPRSLGLVAQISGGLDFSAGFGPGQLRDVFAEVTYNPDREDETEIHGHGIFAIPADAGLTLRGDLGLGLSIGIASLSGGIELAGTLGLEGEAAAEADLSWSPQTGVVLDAEGRITVNPKFIFEINAFARATLGIGWFSISETWRHNLASFSWGPDIQFGIVFPVHYREDQPFEISPDDTEVIYPDLDVVEMAVDLARDIKDDIFA